jgi:ribonuclease HII
VLNKRLKLSAAQASELEWANLRYDHIIGVDEVGRGCLAGPVVAGSVLFSRDHSQWSAFKDSKTLSEIKRNELSQQICASHTHALGMADQMEIDEINILRASLLAMKRSIMALNLPANESKVVLVDGNQFIDNLDGYDQIAVIQGDQWIPVISAASIVAKVHRDSLMKDYESQFPGFGFIEHKGYATQGHRDAIAKLGVTVLHRKSFKGVREHVL